MDFTSLVYFNTKVQCKYNTVSMLLLFFDTLYDMIALVLHKIIHIKTICKLTFIYFYFKYTASLSRTTTI